MSWKLRQGSRKTDTSTSVVLFIVFPAIIGLLFSNVPTLIILSLMVFFKVFKVDIVKQKEPTLFNKQERIEREKRDSENFDPNYKGSESYQALLKKYDGNIPGSGQGDNSGEKMGKRGGRFIKRISKKTGKPYRHYY